MNKSGQICEDGKVERGEHVIMECEDMRDIRDNMLKRLGGRGA